MNHRGTRYKDRVTKQDIHELPYMNVMSWRHVSWMGWRHRTSCLWWRVTGKMRHRGRNKVEGTRKERRPLDGTVECLIWILQSVASLYSLLPFLGLCVYLMLPLSHLLLHLFTLLALYAARYRSGELHIANCTLRPEALTKPTKLVRLFNWQPFLCTHTHRHTHAPTTCVKCSPIYIGSGPGF